MNIKRINIIGRGNVGSHFANTLGDKVAGVAGSTGSSVAELPEDIDLNIIAVSDDAIREVADQLPKSVPVVHTSGTVSMKVFSEFDEYGIFYPLQTFSKNREVNISVVPFLLEACSEEFMSCLEKFCNINFSSNVYRVNSKDRANVHIAAVFANNFSTLMLHEAEEILKRSDLPLSILKPLMAETIEKIMRIGAAESLTGPAKRGDDAVIKKHIDTFKEEELKQIYKLLSKRIQRL